MQTINGTIKTSIHPFLLDSKYKLLEFMDEIEAFLSFQFGKLKEKISLIGNGSHEIGDRILLLLFGTKLLLEFEDVDLERHPDIDETDASLKSESTPIAPVLLFQVSTRSGQAPVSDNTVRTPGSSSAASTIRINGRSVKSYRVGTLLKRFLRFLFLKHLERWEELSNQTEISRSSHTTNSGENRFKT